MRVLFVHGAFARDGSWWWAPVAGLLQQRGIASAAVALPSCGEAGVAPTGTGPGLADDAAAVRAALDGSEPSIVVAHSYGGMVVSEAAAGHPGVACLVYISSFLPEVGQSLAGLSSGEDPVPVRMHEDGSVSVIAAGLDARFLHDVGDPGLVRGARARLTAQSASVFGTPAGAAAWQQTPTLYLVCADDRSTAPALQRQHAARASRTVELPTGHHPFLSRPDMVAAAIEHVSAD